MRFKKTKWFIIVGCAFGTVCLIIGSGLAMRGEIKVSGKYPEDVKDESIKCTSTTFTYPFFTYGNENSRALTISALFSEGTLKTISLQYELTYDDNTKVVASEAHNHAAMNKSFGGNGLNADALRAHYSKTNDKMIMSLYSNGNELAESQKKYFLLQGVNIDAGIEKIKDNYRQLGITCINN